MISADNMRFFFGGIGFALLIVCFIGLVRALSKNN